MYPLTDKSLVCIIGCMLQLWPADLGGKADACNRAPAWRVAVQHHFQGKQDRAEAHGTGAVVLVGKGWSHCDTCSGKQHLHPAQRSQAPQHCSPLRGSTSLVQVWQVPRQMHYKL